MLKLFLRECLLFQSTEKINHLFGILGWISLGLLVYAIGNLLTGVPFCWYWGDDANVLSYIFMNRPQSEGH